MNKTNDLERPYGGFVINGFVMLLVILLIIAAIVLGIVAANSNPDFSEVCAGITAVGAILIVLILVGMFVQQPNQCRVMIFFGKYRGSFKGTGFFWANPFCSRQKVSLRIRNMDIDPIKVNDKDGKPVMIGMGLVWKVADTYKAVFDIDSDSGLGAAAKNPGAVSSARERALNEFVRIQSDAALREVTGHYAYDDPDNASDDELTLRSGGDEINDRLERKINERLAMAGIEVVEARINYLAYAPEIAAVMLRRQQASAVISAREKIVEGAVSMVKMALDRLSEDKVVSLDEERKAAMVSNLLVVLCADEAAQPVVNTGSIYQ